MTLSSICRSASAKAFAISVCYALSFATWADELREPQTLSSSNGVLNILMVAQPTTLNTFYPQQPVGFTYSVCKRPWNGSETCPAPPPGTVAYAGPLLKLKQGDTLKIHLVNNLPPLIDSKHAKNPEEPNETYLALDPTNIHTHGLLVSPHYPTTGNPTYGDNVYVTTFNPANGMPPPLAAEHADVRIHSTDYSIYIPKNHPSGLFWIHPHVHGISLNQISAGLAGMITIGEVGDYVCNNAACSNFFGTLPIRHINIKDLQVLADGTRKDQPDTTMCLSPATGGLVLPPLNGYCVGQDFSGSGGTNYTGARWFFAVNGQLDPTIAMKAPGGEVWRVLNASGSATHNLSIYNPANQTNLIFQVLAVDGITVDSRSAGNSYIGKFHIVPCPGAAAADPNSAPLCADQMLMMPSSRVELWVAYRNANGILTAPPTDASAVLLDSGYNTGPAGDTWPAVNLAHVSFTETVAANQPVFLVTSPPPVSITNPLEFAQDINQDATTASISPDQGVDPNFCTPLPAGHRRRIYFNVPGNYADLFGLGYEEIDATQPPDQFGNYPGVPGTFRVVTEFNAASPTVCLPLGPGNSPVQETWELVNLAGENHNFHIHQTKFRVISMPPLSGDETPHSLDSAPVYIDNVPVVHANGTTDPTSPNYDPSSPGGCVSVAAWKTGVCPSAKTIVSIPFYVAGDFVYHCHILEHEDGGMMGRIRVRLGRGNGQGE